MSIVLNSAGGGSVTISEPNTASNRTLTLPDNTGNLISTADSGTVSPTMLSQKLTLMTAQTASGSSVDFTGIPSWAKRLTLILSGVSTNGTSNYLVQIGDGAVTTTGYSSVGTGMDATGVSITAYTAGFGIRSTSAAYAVNGLLVLTLISANTWVASGVLSTALPLTFTTSGSKSLTNALDRIRITTVNGTDTFDAGTINVMYEG